MLLLSWKYAFSIKPYSSCNSRIYLSMSRFWGYIRQKKRKRKKIEEKVRRGRENDKCHTRREGSTSLK
jgi:hypothetical protein